MTNIKKVSVISLILFICFQVIKIIMVQFWQETYEQKRIEFYPKALAKYEYYTISQSSQRIPSVYIGEATYRIEGKETIEVNGMGVSTTYPLFETIMMLEGNFWGKQAELEGRQVVVISQDLAAKLFNTYKVIGEMIKLGEKYYRIIGVYRKPYQGIWNFVDDGGEDIYFPITSSLGKQLDIKSIWLEDEEATEQLNLGEGTYYRAIDALARLKSIRDAGTNLLVLILIIYLFKESMLNISSFILGMDSLYAKVNSHPKEQVGYLVLSLISIFILSKACLQHLYIPSEVLPPYNIFDWNYYWTYFKEQIIMHQKMMKLSVTAFENIYWLLTKWSLWLTVLQLGLCFPIAKALKNGLIFKLK